MKRVTFRTFDYIPVERTRPLFTVIEKPYIHKSFTLQRHRHHRWFSMYKNHSGDTLVYFNPKKFKDFNTICNVLSGTSLHDFATAVQKLFR